jgi:dihydroorotate dehydrogenase
VTRRSGERALVNSMGFPNPGAAVVAKRLRGLGRQTIVGVNIGKTKAVAVEDTGGDYAACAALVAGCADYLVLNVSSPNTPGHEDEQDRHGDRQAPVVAAALLEPASAPRVAGSMIATAQAKPVSSPTMNSTARQR